MDAAAAALALAAAAALALAFAAAAALAFADDEATTVVATTVRRTGATMMPASASRTNSMSNATFGMAAAYSIAATQVLRARVFQIVFMISP